MNQEFETITRLAKAKNLDLHVCPTCRLPQVEIAPGDWTWQTGTYRWEGKDRKCDCAWQDTLRRRYLLAEIPFDYWTLGWDDFFGDADAKAATQEYLAGWDDEQRYSPGTGLDFYSPTLGVGKTLLAILVVKELIQRSQKVLFTTFRDIVNLVHREPEVRHEQIQHIRNVPILVLDEINAGWTPAQRELFASELEDVIRWRTSGSSVTITTTNMTPEELDEAFPRVFSLLAAKQQRIQVNGMDARRSGDLDLLRQELVLNKESKPIV